MKLKLSEYLVCPECKAPLNCKVFQEDANLPWIEVLEGCLICTGCGQQYAISGGIPRMLGGQLPKDVQQTVDGFGWEWNTFNQHIQNSFMTDKDLFLDFIYPTNEGFFRNKLVLDAGCGMGRFLKLGAEFGSREIIGVDLSHSVNAAYSNTRALPNAHVVQANILALPFVNQFDYIFSVGVLHHMQNPRQGFSELAGLLTENGRLSVWVYAKENNGWVIYLLAPLRKYITSHLPRPVLYVLSHLLGLVLYPCVQLIYKPANENRSGYRLGRLLPYNDYLYHISRFNYASLISIIFDHLVPQLASYISREEVQSWFREEKLSAVTISSRSNMSWRGQGSRARSLEPV